MTDPAQTLQERIQEDQVIAYLFRRTWTLWKAALPDRSFPALPARDKACAALFWRLVEDGVLDLEIDDDDEKLKILPGNNFPGTTKPHKEEAP